MVDESAVAACMQVRETENYVCSKENYYTQVTSRSNCVVIFVFFKKV